MKISHELKFDFTEEEKESLVITRSLLGRIKNLDDIFPYFFQSIGTGEQAYDFLNEFLFYFCTE